MNLLNDWDYVLTTGECVMESILKSFHGHIQNKTIDVTVDELSLIEMAMELFEDDAWPTEQEVDGIIQILNKYPSLTEEIYLQVTRPSLTEMVVELFKDGVRPTEQEVNEIVQTLHKYPSLIEGIYPQVPKDA